MKVRVLIKVLVLEVRNILCTSFESSEINTFESPRSADERAVQQMGVAPGFDDQLKFYNMHERAYRKARSSL